MRLHALCAGLVFAAAATAPGPATAATYDVYYVCGNNLCRVDSTGANPAQVTTDGQPDPGNYKTPSASRDGTVLAFLRDTHAYVADANAQNRREIDAGWFHHDVRISPSGKFVSVLRRGYFPDGYWTYVYNADGTNPQFANTPGIAAGWLGDRFLAEDDYGALCTWILGDQLSTLGCERRVAIDPAHYLMNPEGSPDGSRLLVTTLTKDGAMTSHIALFDPATGQLIRDIGLGSGATFSPDGTQIAFERDRNIYVMPADGTAGSEKLLTAGSQPAWGAKRADVVQPQPGPQPQPSPGPQRLLIGLAGPKKVTVGAGLSFTVRLRRAATLRIRVDRRAGRRWQSAGSVKKAVKAGRTQVRIRRLGGKPLRLGTYRVSIRASEGGATVRIGTLTYRVVRGGTR